MSNKNLEKLVWVLIYGGLLVASLGFFIKRQDAHLGWTLAGAGGVAAVLGAICIFIRARRP